VPCCGGIENARLLLWSKVRNNNGLFGNLPLGRYWMEHLPFRVGDALLAVDRFLAAIRMDLSYRDYFFFSPTAALMSRANIGNASIHVIIRKRLKSDSINVKQLVESLLCVAPTVGTRIAHWMNKRLVCVSPIRMVWEQVPMSENRIALDAVRDSFGIPRPLVYWTKSDQDRRTPRTCTETFGEYLITQDIGRVARRPFLYEDIPFPTNDQIGWGHHMGGTRMGSDPTDSVVNSDCKVHGIENLYIGGSSVFRTGGHANPTLTIVQLALRLADLLHARKSNSA